jgi:hypothetical protein
VRIGHFQSFTATVTGASGGVTWSVNDIPGGDNVVGTIDSNGQYLPPTVVPSPPTVTVRATSVAAPTSSGAATVTIIAHAGITSVSPSPVSAGNFTLTVNGAGFVAGTIVSFDGAQLTTSFVSSIQVTATGNAPAAKSSVPISVTTPDGDVSNTVFVDVVAPPPVSIAISPASATVRLHQGRQFTATIQGTSNTSATWKVNGIVGGNGTVGTISQSGAYKAPNTLPSPATVTVSATAVADPSKTATATVTITKK